MPREPEALHEVMGQSAALLHNILNLQARAPSLGAQGPGLCSPSLQQEN